MGTGLTKTKRRISSISSTEKTTKAMELIATVKLKRFKDAYEKVKNYDEELTDLMGELFAYDKETASHYAKKNLRAEKSLYIVLTSNLGLCGSYNASMFKFVEENVPQDSVVSPIGNKGIHHFGRSETFTNVSDEFSTLDLSSNVDDVKLFCQKIKDDFNSMKYRSIHIVYTRYINSISFAPTLFQLLPIQVPHKMAPDESYCPPLFDDSVRSLIHSLIPDYLTSIFYERLIESQLSEQASRRTAMDNANDNADSLLAKLKIEYNKARQNAITQEITEVVGGSVNN